MPSSRRIFVTIISLILLAFALWMSGVEGIFTRLTSFPLWVTGSMLALLFVNLFLVSFRFWRVLEHFGIKLPWKVASRASISGHVAGLFMISLFGQVMGRQSVLRNYQVQSVVISALAAYERTILAIVSGVLGVFGTIYLFGYEVVVGFMAQISITEILIAAIGGGLLSLWFGCSHFERALTAQAITWPNVARIAEVTGVTLLGQLLVLACFVLGVMAIDPKNDVTHLFAAAAVISFAATMPITVNGWGVREMVAVYVLGKLGVSPTDAVTVSILVGICSTLVIIFVAPFSLKKLEITPMATSQERKIHSVDEIEKITAWCLGMIIAVAVFFQAYISLPNGVVNLNLADPFAILALGAVSLHALFSRQLPKWHLKHFNLALGVISILLLVGFVRGWVEIGITQWALGGRLIGWLVLLGYLSAGYLVVTHAGSHGLRRFAETIIATASVVVVLQVVLRFMDHLGMGIGGHPSPNFEGFAGNRNAFAFQLLSTATLLLGYSTIYAKYREHKVLTRGVLSSMLLGILLAGLFWTGSRAGIAVGVMLLFGAWFSQLANRSVIGWGVVFAVTVWLAVWLAGHILAIHGVSVQSTFSGDYSDNERLATFTHALTLWRDSPLLGAGLGVFIAKSSTWSSVPVVIHSTPLWILAEFGLLGIAVLGWVFVIVSRHALKFQKLLPTRRSLLMLLAVFSVFSLAHEIFYQRIFWLLLGALLAQPFAHRNSV